MSRLKFFSSVCIGLFVYIILTTTLGQNGIWAYRQLEAEKNALTENVVYLQSVNQNLTLEYSTLENDEARIKAMARKLGYVCDGEVLVKINGISERGNKVYDCGSIYRTADCQYIDEHVCKLMGVIFFIISCLLFTINGMKKRQQTVPVRRQSPVSVL